jgi:hypothetical protein
MANSYPTSLNNYTGSETLLAAEHAQAHNALEAKVGVDNSSVTTSHDYKLSGVTGTDKAVSKTGTETLTNKTLTTPTITSPTINTSVTGSAFLDEDDMASNSATKVASQQSIKAYVDSGTVTMTNKTLTTPILASFYQDAGKTKLMTTPNTASDTLCAIAATQTLTNKRITKRTGTTTSSATPTINTDNIDFYSLTAQAVDITSFTTNLSGTPTEGQTLWIAITGTAARAITWGASFEASTVPLPTTTVSTNRLDIGFVWNTVTSKWRCVATA